RTTHHHAREAPGQRVFDRHYADIDVALLEDAVLGDERFDIVERLEERSAELVNVFNQLGRQILVDATWTEVSCVHPRTGRALVKHHQLLARLEAPQRRGQRANVHRLRRHVQQVRQQTADLREDHANVLRALGNFDACQLLYGEAVG